MNGGGGQLSCTSQFVSVSDRNRSGAMTAASWQMAPPVSFPTRSAW